MDAIYDGIILGARPQRTDPAGLSRQGRAEGAGNRAQAGYRRGPLALEDPRYPGFLHNTHAFFQRAITAMPWYADLELERHGARYIEPELNVALLTSDGGVLAWWTDIERTDRIVRRIQPAGCRDVAALAHEFVPIVQDILALGRPVAAAAAATNAQSYWSAAAPAAACWRSARCRRWSSSSRSSSIRRCRPVFCSSTVCARSICGVRGFGHHIAALLASPAKAQMSRGGTRPHSRARSKRRCARAAARFRLMTEPKPHRRRAWPRGRRRDPDGEFIRARSFVASSLNPHQTFLDLLDDALVPRRDCAIGSEEFQYNLLAPLFALNLNLREPPRYRGAMPIIRNWQHAFMVIMGLDHCRSVPGHRPPPRDRHHPADSDVGRMSDVV